MSGITKVIFDMRSHHTEQIRRLWILALRKLMTF